MIEYANLITSVGFPIVACIACGLYVRDISEKHRQQISEIVNTHKEETDNLSEAIHNNTLVMEKLVTIISDRSEKNESVD